MAEAKSVDLTEGALETEQHVGIPQKLVKEKAKIQDLGQQKAHFHRDQNANSNALHRRRGKGKGQRSRSPAQGSIGADTSGVQKNGPHMRLGTSQKNSSRSKLVVIFSNTPIS